MKKSLAFGFVLLLMAPAWAQPLPPITKPLPPAFGKPLPSSSQALPPSLERQVRSGYLSRQEASDLYEASKKVSPAAAKPTETKPVATQPAKPSEQTPTTPPTSSDATPKKPEEKTKDKTYSGTINADGFPKLSGTVYLLEAKKENEDELQKLKGIVRLRNSISSVKDLMDFTLKNAQNQETFSDSKFSLKASASKAILVIAVGNATGTEALWVENNVISDQAITLDKGKVLYWAVRPTGQ
jgi:hypothetical protein